MKYLINSRDKNLQCNIKLKRFKHLFWFVVSKGNPGPSVNKRSVGQESSAVHCKYGKHCRHRSINQSFDRSIGRSINQPIKQPINHSSMISLHQSWWSIIHCHNYRSSFMMDPDQLTSINHQSSIKGLRPVLGWGIWRTVHTSRSTLWQQTLQIGLDYDYNMTFSISPREC